MKEINTRYKKRVATQKTNGFVAIFAMLIATIVLIMVMSITRTAYKETLLSGSVRESERAFYAADTGSECGLYLDRIEKNVFIPGGMTTATCGDETVTITTTGLNVYTFSIPIDHLSCTKVEVSKNLIIDSISMTRVIARGYNVSCDDVTTFTSRRIVERKLEVKYPN